MENEKNTKQKTFSNNFWIIIGTLIIILIIIVIVIINNNNNKEISGPLHKESVLVTDDGKSISSLEEMKYNKNEEVDYIQSFEREAETLRPNSFDRETEHLVEGIINLEVSSRGFQPARFAVRAGEKITISVTSTDDFTHIFKFDDPVLASTIFPIRARETVEKVFTSPTEPGEYSFRCNVRGHADRGEVGIMIVR